MLRTAERPFQRKNIGHAVNKQPGRGLRNRENLLAEVGVRIGLAEPPSLKNVGENVCF